MEKKRKIISRRALPYESNVWLWIATMLLADKVYDIPSWCMALVALSLLISSVFEIVQKYTTEPYDPFEQGDVK